MATSTTTWAPRAQAALRIVSALLFLEHGTQKLFGFPAGGNVVGIKLDNLLTWAGILEVVGGLALLAGFQTRVVAFILSGQMAVAYWMAHFPKNPFPANNGGDAAILFCFVFLFLAAAGPGTWSIDSSKRGG